MVAGWAHAGEKPSESRQRAADTGVLKARYEADRARLGFTRDPEQERIVECFDSLRAELQDRHKPVAGLWWKLGSGLGLIDAPGGAKGLYIHGGVGRGKTWLMDLFHGSLPAEISSERVHFHRFMQAIHDELRGLKQTRDPLCEVARRWRGRGRILCLDEFHVTDIADAMLLGRLLHELFARHTVLVTTSNIAPDALYAGGLHRARFLPTIELLKKNLHIIAMAEGEDYRLRALESAETYLVPNGAEAEQTLRARFQELTAGAVASTQAVRISGRDIHARCWVDGVAWFSFFEICETARSTADYIELARYFHTVLIDGIPRLSDARTDATLRLIHLVDEFYDRRVNLLIAADAPIASLYQGTRLASRFARTRSRLREMRSHSYLASAHQP